MRRDAAYVLVQVRGEAYVLHREDPGYGHSKGITLEPNWYVQADFQKVSVNANRRK